VTAPPIARSRRARNTRTWINARIASSADISAFEHLLRTMRIEANELIR